MINLYDNVQALGFLQSQTTYIEAEVYKIQYPEIIYRQIVPIDNSAGQWAKSVTYYSMDKTGIADWFNAGATDMRLADVNRNQFEQGIEMAGIGYRYNLEEIGQAMMIPGLNLSAERAEAAAFGAEQFLDKLARFGDTSKGVTGILNNAFVTVAEAAPTGTGSSTLWSAKTADQMIADVNAALTGVYEGSNTVEMADTVLLPIAQIQLLANTRVPNTMASALDFLAANNLYTFYTKQQLNIRGILNLDTAGHGSSARMVVYRNDPRVLKLHIPMPHHFLPVFQTGPITFDIPGILRVGSVEVRRPGAMRYVDGI